MISCTKEPGKDGKGPGKECRRTTEGNTMSALDHPLTQSLLNLNPLNLLNHLRPEPLMLLLVLDMSELSSVSTRTTERLLRDGVESTFDGLWDGVLVS
jgi:hypothetical protein